jgi:hypothetical protein
MDIGTGWTVTKGTAVLNGSGAFTTPTYTSGEAVAVFSTSASDGLYEMTMTPQVVSTNNVAPGMIFRYVDNNNYWLFQLFGGATNGAQLYKKVAGVFTKMVDYAMTVTGGVAHLVDISLKGPVITVNIDGAANEITVTDAFNQTATGFGIRSGNSGAPPAPVYSGMSLNQNGTALAWPIFTRFASNPILVTGTAGGWEETDLAAPQPFWDPVGNQWIIQYSGYSSTIAKWGTGIAKNSDITNLGGWVKSAHNPFFADALDGVMLYFNGAFWLWAATNGTQGTSIFAWKKNSQNIDDGGAWTVQNGGSPVLVGGPGAYDAGGVFELDCQIVGSTLVAYIVGRTTPGLVRTISYATSTDGVTFTKFGSIFTNAPFSSDNTQFGSPSVNPTAATVQAPQFLINDGKGDSKYTGRYSDMRYFDGTIYHPRAQLMVPIGTGWEKAQVFDTNQILVNGVWYMFYAGSTLVGAGQGLNAQIGAATAPYTGIG